MNACEKENDNDIQKIGICGDDCNCCPRYISTNKSGEDELEKVLKLWIKFGLRDLSTSPEELKCYGCSPHNKCAYIKQRDCALEKGIENCGECNNYPCKIAEETFRKSEAFAIKCKGSCTEDEYKMIDKAFFRKKGNLDNIHLRKKGMS